MIKPSETLELVGTGILMILDCAYIMGRTLNYYRTPGENYQSNLRNNHIILPAIRNLLTEDEKNLLQERNNWNLEMKVLGNIATRERRLESTTASISTIASDTLTR